MSMQMKLMQDNLERCLLDVKRSALGMRVELRHPEDYALFFRLFNATEAESCIFAIRNGYVPDGKATTESFLTCCLQRCVVKALYLQGKAYGKHVARYRWVERDCSWTEDCEPFAELFVEASSTKPRFWNAEIFWTRKAAETEGFDVPKQAEAFLAAQRASPAIFLNASEAKAKWEAWKERLLETEVEELRILQALNASGGMLKKGVQLDKESGVPHFGKGKARDSISSLCLKGFAFWQPLGEGAILLMTDKGKSAYGVFDRYATVLQGGKR